MKKSAIELYMIVYGFIFCRAINHLEELTGERAEKVKLANTEYTSRMWRYWMTEEPADFNMLLGNGQKLNPFVEVAKKLVGQSEFTLASIYSLVDSVLPQENEAVVKEFTRKCDEELTVDNIINIYMFYAFTWI